jgi:hypothetical protein
LEVQGLLESTEAEVFSRATTDLRGGRITAQRIVIHKKLKLRQLIRATRIDGDEVCPERIKERTAR